VTGNLFFAPSATFLESVGDEELAGVVEAPGAPPLAAPKRDGSLGIGSLKGGPSHE
jgi:putative iron-dependent peroxidase